MMPTRTEIRTEEYMKFLWKIQNDKIIIKNSKKRMEVLFRWKQ